MVIFLQAVKSIGKALVIRGFSVRILHDRIISVPGAASYEWEDLKLVLQQAQIDYRENEGSLTILNIRDLERAIELIQFHKQERLIPEPLAYDWNWKSFTRRKFSRKSSALDHTPGVAYLVKSLGRAGILTAYSRDGHGKGRPYIEFTGSWNAIWFEYLLTYHLPINDLHYKWKVKQKNHRSFYLTPLRSSEQQRWVIRKIQEDTVRIGAWLSCFAENIRNLKQSCFKYRSMKHEAKKREEDFEALKQWMYEKINRNMIYTYGYNDSEKVR